MIALWRGIVPGLNGFAVFCCTIAVCSRQLGAAMAFSLATAAAVALVLTARTRG